jgi:F-type H+-transporting ATPase subunit gamma
MSQEVTLQRLLPAGFEEVELHPEIEYATVEPSLEELVRAATVRLLEAQLYQARLEAVASEQSMRMIAMKNATDNASDIIEDLTLEFNNARQAAITQELAEISGGAEALNG